MKEDHATHGCQKDGGGMSEMKIFPPRKETNGTENGDQRELEGIGNHVADVILSAEECDPDIDQPEQTNQEEHMFPHSL